MTQLTLEFTEAEKVRAKSNAEKILDMLNRGPVCSTDLISVTHRFSACIKNLRERGFEIRVYKEEDGTSTHTLVSYTPLVEVTEEMQAAYYITEHWKLKRNQRMSHDDFRCCHCRSRESLQVHHWLYELFTEAIEDLVTLCDGCHERIHQYDCVKLHFPKYVTAEIAERITGKSAMKFFANTVSQ